MLWSPVIAVGGPSQERHRRQREGSPFYVSERISPSRKYTCTGPTPHHAGSMEQRRGPRVVVEGGPSHHRHGRQHEGIQRKDDKANKHKKYTDSGIRDLTMWEVWASAAAPG